MAVEPQVAEAQIPPASTRESLQTWVRRHWEVAVYVALVVIALGTRMWDVGGRALHYDEILHVWYSWRYVEGMGYSHTPLTHGPFLFHANAAAYWLLGSSDVASRLVPALFGTVLVGMPYFLRRELGRYGAMTAAVLLTISPSILYFGRFIRNDIFMAVWALALVTIIWRYQARPRFWLLVAWAAIWALAFSSKESSYMLAAILGLLLFTMSYQAYFDWVRGRARLSELPPAGQLLLVLVTLSLPLWAPLLALFQEPLGILLANHDLNDPRVVSGAITRASAETGAPVGGALYIAAFIVLVFTVLATVLGLLWNRQRWPILAGVFAVIWVPLFTSMFTNWRGFFTGLWGSLGYWIAQQPVERASQPWYYYTIGLSVYEFLPVLIALPGAAYFLWKGRAFDRFLVGWAFLTFAAFTYAGEKMPWLLVGIVLPLIVLAGRTVELLIGRLITERSWTAVLPPFTAGLVLAVAVPYIATQIGQTGNYYTSLGFWIALLGLLGVAALAISLRTLTAAEFGRVLTLGSLAVLVVFTGWNALRATYSYASYERPRELLVYSQTGQESRYAAECIDRVAAASGKGAALQLIVDTADNFQWQWRWYVRDYPNVTYNSLQDQPVAPDIDADFVLMSQVSEGANNQVLAERFVRIGELRHLWWFPNTAYEHLTPSKLLKGATSRAGWTTATRYFFQREFSSDMYRSNGIVYVKKELAGLAEGCTALRATPSL